MKAFTFMKGAAACAAVLLAGNLWAGTPFSNSGNPVPGTIEAENYDKDGDGVSYHWNRPVYDGEPTTNDYRSDAHPKGIEGHNGGYHLGNLDGGTWTIYTINVAETASYDITTFYAKGNDGTSSFKFYVDDVEVKSVTIEGTGSWDNFATSVVSSGIELTEGTHAFKFSTDGGFNVDRFVFAKGSGAQPVGRGLKIPGKIEAEDFDEGGEGVAYHWSNKEANQDRYRTDANFIGAGGTGYNLGWTSGGDWTLYTVTVEQTGYYRMKYNAASGVDAGGSFYFADKNDKRITRTCAYPMSGWDDYVVYEMTNIYLEAGEMTLKWVCGGGVNIDYFDFEFIGTTPEVTAVIPGVIQAEDYDEGGALFHNVNREGGLGSQYRPNQNVYLEQNNGSYTIGNTAYDDQFQYSFTALKGGKYALDCYVCCGNDNGKFTITLDGFDLAGEVQVPNNGWNNYATPITLSDVNITTGDHVMLFTVKGDCNIDRFDFRLVEESSTGISEMQTAATESAIYTLSGMRLTAPTKSGIYVKNGKKVILK